MFLALTLSLLQSARAEGLAQVPLTEAVTEGDLVLRVEPDGDCSLDGVPVKKKTLKSAVAKAVESTPERRIAVVPHADAPFEGILDAVELAEAASPGHVALVFSRAPTTSLFAEGVPSDAVPLDAGLSQEEQKTLAPKRWKFPQNPYTHTDFTAYTLEWGETKLGLASIQSGVLPRIQLGTAPLLDVLGVYNGQLKVNAVREGPFDASINVNVITIPVTKLLQKVDSNGDWGFNGGDDKFTAHLTYMGFGAGTSLQVVGGWSLHAGASYARATGTGKFDFQAMPPMLFAGLDPDGDTSTLVTSLRGELVQLRAATDYRFNRRDSLILQFASPVFAQATGKVSGAIPDVPELGNLDVAVSYGDMLPLDAGYRGSLAWQFSWRRVDLRFGAGLSPIPGSWLTQAFDLSVRLGGETRRTENRIRQGYQENLKDLERGADESG